MDILNIIISLYEGRGVKIPKNQRDLWIARKIYFQLSVWMRKYNNSPHFWKNVKKPHVKSVLLSQVYDIESSHKNSALL